MRQTQLCPQCGGRYLPGEVQGLCPRCLRRMLLQFEAGEMGNDPDPVGQMNTQFKGQPTEERFDIKSHIPARSGFNGEGSRVAYLVSVLVLTANLTMGQSSSPSRALVKPVQANRTLPKVSPPKTGFEFSVNPTTQEIFCARVFEEPLVPISGEPTAAENAALAAALHDYSKRNGPDDFSSLLGELAGLSSRRARMNELEALVNPEQLRP